MTQWFIFILKQVKAFAGIDGFTLPHLPDAGI